MPHFGIICPPITGHIEPLAAVGRALIRRGHRVTFFHVPDTEARIRAAGLEFAALGAAEYPVGTLPASVKKLSELSGVASLRFAVESACGIARIILRDGPEAMSSAGIDCLIVDQNEPAGGSVAEHLGIPFLSACTSLPLNRAPDIPPPFVGWPYSDSPMARLRNRIGYAVSDRIIAPIQETLNEARGRWGLSRVRNPNDTFSTVAQIAQMPREFDYPRREPLRGFHYLGPWFDRVTSGDVLFPWEQLDGRPIVYGSLGTLQESDTRLFRIMAEACDGLNAQLVLSLGSPAAKRPDELRGSPIVVNYAPQLELLSRAALTITHGGMNTTQQSLYFGVPLVAIPLAHDQPAIAARLERTGAGRTIAPKKVTAEDLRRILIGMLDDGSSWKRGAREISRLSQAAGGAERAAEIAESVVWTRTGK